MLRAIAVVAAIVILNFATVRIGAELVEQSGKHSAGADPLSAAAAAPSAVSTQNVLPQTPARDAHLANDALLQQKLAELHRLQGEIDQLRAATGTLQQILVKVQVLEVSRTRMQKQGLAFNLRSVGAKSNGKNAVQKIESPGDTFELRIIDERDALRGFVNLLEENRIAKILAEPSLVVVSGRPASFNVGGELLMPAPQGSKNEIRFQSFGTKIDVLAVARGNNKVVLELCLRLVEPDYSRAVAIDGAQLPAMKVRQLDTAVELAAGQTGMLSGLVQPRQEVVQTESGMKTEIEEVETWFIVTPEFVPSVAAAPARRN
jgi:Flp pilus assembly secretin CpaC